MAGLLAGWNTGAENAQAAATENSNGRLANNSRNPALQRIKAFKQGGGCQYVRLNASDVFSLDFDNLQTSSNLPPGLNQIDAATSWVANAIHRVIGTSAGFACVA